MADFTRMIPFIFHFAAGVPVEDLTKPIAQQWEIAKRKGWSDDPDDRGGKTMIDVTLATYQSYCKKHGYPVPTGNDLKNIPFYQWLEILKTMYWDKMQGDKIIYQGIANICVDWLWASGTGKIKNIQRILGVTADGIVGPKTISAINSSNPIELFKKIYNARATFYQSCSEYWKYGKGWMRRLNAINGDGTFTINGKTIK